MIHESLTVLPSSELQKGNPVTLDFCHTRTHLCDGTQCAPLHVTTSGQVTTTLLARPRLTHPERWNMGLLLLLLHTPECLESRQSVPVWLIKLIQMLKSPKGRQRDSEVRFWEGSRSGNSWLAYMHPWVNKSINYNLSCCATQSGNLASTQRSSSERDRV